MVKTRSQRLQAKRKIDPTMQPLTPAAHKAKDKYDLIIEMIQELKRDHDEKAEKEKARITTRTTKS